MKKSFLFVVVSVLLFGLSAPVYAGQWIDVGPASMPLSEFNALHRMVKGEAAEPTIILSATRELVDVGTTSMPRADFTMIAGLVHGDVKADQNNYTRREKMVDLGIVAMGQSEMDTLTGMVHDGLLQHWQHRVSSNVAVE